MTIQPQIAFQPVQLSDAPQLFAWHRRPHVARWWDIGDGKEPNFEAFERELRDELAANGPSIFIITLDARPIGFLQTYHAASAGDSWWPDEPDSTHGIDLFIGEASLIDQGLGPAIVRAFAARLFAEADVESIIIDPNPANRRAVRCFEKAGFVAEGEIITPDGLSLLMRLRRASSTH